MIDDTFEDIDDVANPLTDKMPYIIEYFVEFYGEEFRERITQRLNDAIFVFVEKGKKNALKKYFVERKNEIALQFETALEEDYGYDVVNDVIAQGDYLLNIISDVKRWKDGISKKDIEKVYSFLDMVRDNDLAITSPKHLEKLLRNRKTSEKIYQLLDNVYSLYEKYFKEDMDYLIQEEDRLIKDDEEDKINQINDKYEKDCQEAVSVKLISLLSIPMNEKNILSLNKISSIIVDRVLKDRKFYTFYDNEQYSKAFNALAKMSDRKITSEDVEKLIDEQSKGLKEEIDKLRDKADNEISKVLSRLNYVKSRIVKEVVEGETYIKEINDFFKNSSSKTAGFNITGVSRKDPNKTVSICCNSTALDLYDDVMIHELGHVIAADVEHVSGKSYTYRSGITSELRSAPFFTLSNTPKSYKVLNEVLNEYFSSKICEKMYDEDFTIGINGPLGQGVTYRRAFPLVKDFINENLEFLKKCYISNDYVALDNKFGRDNIRALAKVLEKRINIEGRVNKSALQIMKQDIEVIKKKITEYRNNTDESDLGDDYE